MKMQDKTLGIAAAVLGVLLVLGMLYLMVSMPNPGDFPKCPACPECKPVVITETETITETIEVDADYKQRVVDALLDEIGKDKALRMCDDDKYSTSEIAVKRVYNGFTLTEDSDGDTSISDVRIKLNYDDGKCYRTLSCGLDAEQELVC